ncbi:MAG: copper-binding protein [Burkholderiaceae bacterium]|nr:copper-binding protein [Burkholderiaceae bacterium]
MKFKTTLIGFSILATSSILGLVQAQTSMTMAPGEMQMSAEAMTSGEVRKVDKENKKITLKHADIKNLDMPGMTMVFQVKDPAMLDMVKPGDKVMFTAEKANGTLMITAIQPAK